MGAPNPRYLGFPISRPRTPAREPRVGARGVGERRGRGGAAAGATGPGAGTATGPRRAAPLEVASAVRRGGVPGCRKRERAGTPPSDWLRVRKLPGAARQDPLLGDGAAGGGAGDHPGRAPPRLAAGRPRGPRGAAGRGSREARRWPGGGQEAPERRRGICWPTQPTPQDFTLFCFHSCPYCPVFAEARPIPL